MLTESQECRAALGKPDNSGCALLLPDEDDLDHTEVSLAGWSPLLTRSHMFIAFNFTEKGKDSLLSLIS